MKVFIGWSGEASHRVAEAMHGWLPRIIQAAKPWISSEDIAKGATWQVDLKQGLNEAKAGIICVTPGNLEEPWIHFEAGALSNAIEKAYVCPYLVGLTPANLGGPLAQFQATTATRADTLKLVKTINEAIGRPLEESQLVETFEYFWPKFEEKLKEIAETPSEPPPHRDDREILEEILAVVRAISQDSALSRWTKMLKPPLVGSSGVEPPLWSVPLDKLEALIRKEAMESRSRSLQQSLEELVARSGKDESDREDS
ncbi:MAG: TIR domain-containing protein [Thermodesulfobacteriota bacterium]